MKLETGNSPSVDITTSSVRRVGALAALVAAAFSEGCASMPHHKTVEAPISPVVAPIDPSFRDAQKAFDFASKLGLDHVVYIGANGNPHSALMNVREMSLAHSKPPSRGVLEDFDTTITHDGSAKRFKMGSFMAWQKTQAESLKGRADVQAMLITPGAGLLYSIRGRAFLVRSNGNQIETKELEPVQPFANFTEPR